MIKKITFIRTAVLLLVLCSFTGCFKEDYSLCPPEEPKVNARLDFRLLNNRGNDVFADNITSVNIGVFNNEGVYLFTEHLNHAALMNLQGVDLLLTPGKYRIVFWANINENTKIEGLDGTPQQAAPRITYNGIMSRSALPVCGNGDRVYYAPCESEQSGNYIPGEYYSLTILPNTPYTDVVYFTHAHRSLEIYIKGLSKNLAELPSVEISGLPAGLKYFGMNNLISNPLSVVSSRPTAIVTQNDIQYAMTRFDTFFFREYDNIEIIIRGAGGGEIYRITLADAINQSNADPDKIIISLILSFMEGEVSVSLPGWNSGDTGVEFGE